MSAAVVDALLAAGWQREAPRPGASARAAYGRGDGTRLVVELRGSLLWLVIDEPAAGERRVIGIEPTVAPDAVAAAIRRVQDSLSVATYLEAYGELGDVGDISIMMWERFDPEWG